MCCKLIPSFCMLLSVANAMYYGGGYGQQPGAPRLPAPTMQPQIHGLQPRQPLTVGQPCSGCVVNINCGQDCMPTVPPYTQQPMPPYTQQPIPPYTQQPMPPYTQQPIPPYTQPYWTLPPTQRPAWTIGPPLTQKPKQPSPWGCRLCPCYIPPPCQICQPCQ
ncbi:sheath protein 5, identical [Brugia malayi]|uniref:Bm8725 n=1 Tax=Brugia malayi TaxID=6279 RepID=Q6RCM3_BRUMA|nr:sheath protein 5, identical [Brugia malayi]AAR89900.1 sheath protein 5 [Brugia malayi]CDP91848.1 Bm8725 [Brugia malayi]VIO90385.1 sheath protein 5, identical [Brugia malayi]